MKRNDVDLAIEWAAAEGWNPGINDAACFYEADTNGFLMGMLDDEPVATISATRYGRTFGFIGFYIVKPEYRGKGYGIRIWNAASEYLDGRNVGLDGVVTQQDNYKKSGFKLAYRNIRYEGRFCGTAPAYHPEITSLSSLPLETIDSYDRSFFPEHRTAFLKYWINQGGCNALGIMQNGRLSGYGVIRKCLSGYKAGPLFADSPELAESLFHALCSGIKPEEPVYLDVPEPNCAAVKMAERHNMKIAFETARMYTKQTPDLSLDHIFGVTSFELG